MSQTLEAWGLTTRLEDAHLCVSELATNALVHGDIAGHGFVVQVTAWHGLIRVEVRDRSKRRPEVGNPDETDTSGRGLQLVTMLSDAWGVEDRASGGKVVWSEFKLDGSTTTLDREPLESSCHGI